MAQTVFGQTDALALSIAAWLNTFPLSMPIKAQRRFVLIDTAPALPDVNSPVQVDIFPDIEICDRQGVSPALTVADLLTDDWPDSLKEELKDKARKLCGFTVEDAAKN